MEIVIKISEKAYNALTHTEFDANLVVGEMRKSIANGTPVPDNATNGEVIKAMFGADKIFGFIHYVHLMAKVGNWFNEGVVAEFDKDWWNSPYQKGSKE